MSLVFRALTSETAPLDFIEFARITDIDPGDTQNDGKNGTDGGCDGNGANGVWGKAGWGAWLCNKTVTSSTVGQPQGPNIDFCHNCP